MKTCDPEDESQMVEVGVDTAGGDMEPLSEPQWRERMAGRRTKELGEARAEVAKVLEELTFCSPRPGVGQAQVAVLWSLAGRLDSVNVSQLQVDSLRHLLLSDKVVTAETDHVLFPLLPSEHAELPH